MVCCADRGRRSAGYAAFTGRAPWYFLAMVHHRLGHSHEARQWLEKANREAEPGVRKNANGAAMPWNRRLTLELLRREAAALLNDRGKPKPD